MYRELIGITALIAVTAHYIRNQNKRIKINEVKLSTKKIKEPVKILQISDFHSNKAIDIIELESLIQDLNPDFAVITGDMAEKNLSPVKNIIDMISRQEFQTYAILGNHEEGEPHLEKYLKIIGESAIIYLDNKVETIEIKGNTINVIGLEHYNPRLSEIRNSFDPNNFNLILSHAPNLIINKVTKDDDLVLSGHTHGGQVRFPLIGAIYVPNQFPFPKYIKGLYELETGTILHVDSGLGNSRLPLRALNPVQISLITIENERQ